MTYRIPAGRAVTPQNQGRYPGFDVLDQVHVWDDVTAGAVLARLAPPNDLGFFTAAERAVAEPLLDLLLAQDREPRVPVLGLIDTRLAIGETDGWHYDDLPEDGQAWRDTLAHLDRDAGERHHRGFARISASEQAGGDPGRAGPVHRTPGLARAPGRSGVEPVDPVRVHRVLLPSLGV